jgi:lysozyme
MSYRDTLKDNLIFDEGLRYEYYLDPVGIKTVGVGHNCQSSPLPQYMQDYYAENGKLKLEHIMELLEKDIDKAEQAARKIFDSFNDWTTNRQIAIVNLLFNMGPTTFSKFITTIAAIRNGQWQAAGAALRNSKWFKQVQPSRSERIIKQITEG